MKKLFLVFGLFFLGLTVEAQYLEVMLKRLKLPTMYKTSDTGYFDLVVSVGDYEVRYIKEYSPNPYTGFPDENLELNESLIETYYPVSIDINFISGVLNLEILVKFRADSNNNYVEHRMTHSLQKIIIDNVVYYQSGWNYEAFKDTTITFGSRAYVAELFFRWTPPNDYYRIQTKVSKLVSQVIDEDAEEAQVFLRPFYIQPEGFPFNFGYGEYFIQPITGFRVVDHATTYKIDKFYFELELYYSFRTHGSLIKEVDLDFPPNIWRTYTMEIENSDGKFIVEVQIRWLAPNLTPVPSTTRLCGSTPLTLTTNRTDAGDSSAGVFYKWQVDYVDGFGWRDIPELPNNSISPVNTVTFSPSDSPERIRYYKVYILNDQGLGGNITNEYGAFPTPVEVLPAAASNVSYTKLDEACIGMLDGSIAVTSVSGVAGNYTFTLGKGPAPDINQISDIRNSNSQTPTFSSLSPGKWWLITENSITLEDGTPFVGCRNVTEIDINAAIPVNFDRVVTNITCYNAKNGSIEILATGGTPPYLYTYDGGVNYISSNKLINQDVGTYNLRVKDSRSCLSSVAQVSINEPAALEATIGSTDPKCHGEPTGTIVVQVLFGAGTAPYEYSINNETFQASSIFSGIKAGTYQVKIKDANNCLLEKDIELSDPSEIQVDLITLESVSCSDASDGIIKVAASGGVSPFTYSINGGAAITLAQFENLAPGDHTILVKDANDCIVSKNYTIQAPLPLSVSFESKKPGCNSGSDGELIANVTGGTMPYFYSWKGYQDFDNTLSNIYSDTYEVTITDNNGCKMEASTFLENVESPVEINVLTENTSCPNICDGIAEVSISGGVAPISISWDDDLNSNSTRIQNLCYGRLYSVTVTDGNHCHRTETVSISSENPFYLSFEENYQLCRGQKLTLDATQPGDNISYTWHGPDGFESNRSRIELSEEGDYTIIIESPEGCQVSKSFSINTSAELLTANFLLPSMVEVSDTVVFIDVSWPVPDSVKWDFGSFGEVINDAVVKPLVVFPERADTYLIKLVAYLGECRDSIEKEIVFYLPEGNNKEIDLVRLGFTKIENINLYPNPTNGEFKVRVVMSRADKLNYTIYKLDGEKIKTGEAGEGKEFDLEYDIRGLKPGYYFIKFQTGEEVRTVGLVKD
ncbi:MAG TPA: T9SS type A sorting domain-containing protein [Cytophagaceae bacterium]